MRNPIRWFEIYVADMARAKKFYESVFGVELRPMLDSPEIEMWGFPADPGGMGCSGSLCRMPGLKPSGVSTIVYFASEDCSVEEQRAAKLGSRIHKSKMSIGEHGFISLIVDSEGNMIGIHSMH